MTEELDHEILIEFIKETQEELDELDAQFIALERDPKDSEVLNSIFRTMHSIKGASAFFNLNHMRNFAHKLENLLDDLRKGTKTVTRDIISLLLSGKDCLDEMLNRLVSGDMRTDLTDADEAVIEKVDALMAEEAVAEKVEPHQLFLKIDGLRGDLEREGLLDKPVMADLLEIVEQVRELMIGPRKEDAGAGAPPLGQMLVQKGLVTHDEVVEALSKQKKLGQILVEEGKVRVDEIEQAAAEQRKKSEEIEEAKRHKAPPAQMAALKKTMRIEEEKIDGFMDAVGELIINAEVFNYLQKKLESGHDADKLNAEFKNANVDLSELLFDLQMGLAEVRKVSVKGIFQKIPRMVRDLASNIGKQVELTVSGEDMLIDKSLFEQLESPLNHLIRNAVDHGVEKPDEREAAGKSPMGRIEVIAEEVSGDFVIRIKDDGKGMNADSLKASAISKGIITTAAAEAMPDKEAYKLIFSPGFSTAEKITDVSGRGVGMDVVMTTIKDNKGKIDINTDLGLGTEFVISVPMSTTLVTISGLVVAVGAESYIIPMEWVRESIRPVRAQVSSVKHRGEVVKIRDELYPIIKLCDVFNVAPKHPDPWDAVCMVIDKDDERACILVDDIIEETQVVLKDLGKMFANIPGILGGAILGDGKIGLVVNVEGVLKANMPEFKTP